MKNCKKEGKESSLGMLLIFKKPPLIVVPQDTEKRNDVFNKFREYESRIVPHHSPGLQMDVICKARVFERLVLYGLLYPPNLQSEMRKKYGRHLSIKEFLNAVKIAKAYCM